MGATVVESESAAQAISLLREADTPNTAYNFVCVDEESFSAEPFAFVAQLNSIFLLNKPMFIQTTQSLSDHDEELMAHHNVIFQITKPVGPHQLYECFRNKFIQKTEGTPQTTVSSLEILKQPKSCLRILVAEDNPILQEVTVAQLEALGCEAAIAPDGDEAVEAIKHGHFDLVLMDVRMPKMNGFHATQAIRELEKPFGHHTTIVAMTGAAMTGDKERCLAAGMDDYISKPINMGDLARVIDRKAEEIKMPPKKDGTEKNRPCPTT
jgi:CheY-like chemotaxis protein